MNIAISGYTAAGKTTHARLLADALGYEHVWAAGRLLEKLGYDTSAIDESRTWFERYLEIARSRGLADVDEHLDAELQDLARDRSDLVIDARFFPWVATSPCIFVWIESDLPSRARKCAVSLGQGAPTVDECADHVQSKDAIDIAMVDRRFEASFAPSERRFNIIVDNSTLIPLPTAECAEKGIERFHPYLLATFQAARGEPRHLAHLKRQNPEEFLQVVRFVSGKSTAPDPR